MKKRSMSLALIGLAAATSLTVHMSSKAQEESAPLVSIQELAEPLAVKIWTSPELIIEEPKQEEPVSIFTAYDAELIGRTIWGEADGVKSKAEQAAVAWCILNRVDARGITIEQAVTARKQFHGYRPAGKWGECPQKHIDLAMDVLQRWEAEKNGTEDVGRVLPAEYQYFVGDGKRNHFTVEYQSTDFWNWSLPSPY